MEEMFPGGVDDSSIYADEGTCAHELGALKIQAYFGEIDEETYAGLLGEWAIRWDRFTKDEAWLVDVHRHTDDYLQLVIDEVAAHPGATVMVERRVDAGVPESDGTADVVILSPTHIVIIDLKYGAGVAVSSFENPQTRLYGAGALREFGDLLGTTETVRMGIFQPRVGTGQASFEEMDADDLREWVTEVVIPAAEEAVKPGGRFSPGEATCRWCPASGRCPAQLEKVFSEPFEEPSGLSPEDMASALERAPLVQRWLSDLEQAALTMMYQEETDVPGWKVVQSGGIRKVSDPEGVEAALLGIGFKKDQLWKQADPKFVGIGDLEKLVGKTDFNSVLGPYVTKTEGKPALAPESDTRPAINRNKEAARVFSAVPEED